MKVLSVLLMLFSMNAFATTHLYTTDYSRCEKNLAVEKIKRNNQIFLEVSSFETSLKTLYKLRECYPGEDQAICHLFSEAGGHLIDIYDDFRDEYLIKLNGCYYTRQ